MRLLTSLRISPGAWLTPVMLGLVWLYVTQSITFAHREPYTLGLTARAMNVLGLVIPVFVLAATWEGVRVGRSGIWAFPFVRRRLGVAAWSVAPAVVGGALVIVVAAIQVLAHEGLVLPDPLIIVLALALLSAQALAGFAVGATWPHVAAVPLVTLISFASFVLPRVLQPVWLLHPFGTSLELCCRNDSVLAPEVAASIVVLSCGLLIAAAVSISSRPVTRTTKATSLGAVALSLAAAALIASPIPMSPTTARLGDATACVDGAHVRVCAWPEHANMLLAAVAAADDAVVAWSAMGLETPKLITEARETPGPDALTVALWTGLDAYDLVADMAWAMVPDAPGCAATEAWRSEVAGPYLWVWFAMTGGVPPDEIRRYEGDARPDPEIYADAAPTSLLPVRPLVDAVLASSPEAQRRWVTANVAAMGACSVDPPLEPS